jgi:hypothetical protein
LCDLLDVIIVGGPNFSRLLKLSVELVAYLGSDRLDNPRRRQFGGDTASAEGASR